MILYVKGVSEHIRRVMSKFKVQVFFKPVNTLRQLLVRPKDPLDKERVIGLVYQIKCSDCDAFYVGETEICKDWVPRTQTPEFHRLRSVAPYPH